jgi:hypothetical protein
MIRERHKWAAPISVRVPRQGNRGGVARSSDEVSVMEMERRSYIVQLYWIVNLSIREELFG